MMPRARHAVVEILKKRPQNEARARRRAVIDAIMLSLRAPRVVAHETFRSGDAPKRRRTDERPRKRMPKRRDMTSAKEHFVCRAYEDRARSWATRNSARNAKTEAREPEWARRGEARGEFGYVSHAIRHGALPLLF